MRIEQSISGEIIKNGTEIHEKITNPTIYALRIYIKYPNYISLLHKFYIRKYC